MADNPPEMQGAPDEEQRKIIDAAERCFERFGPQRTSMSDVADEAGISRRTLYRVFDDRSALVEAILRRRLMGLGTVVREHLAGYDDLAEALVDGSIFSIELAESDELFSEIVRHEHESSVERFLLRPDADVLSVLTEAWTNALDLGRRDGGLHRGLDDRRIVELIAMVQTIVLMRSDLGRDDRRALLADLLLPLVE